MSLFKRGNGAGAAEGGGVKGGKSFFSAARDFVDGDVFLRENVQRQFLFILLLFVLAMVYINNRFMYEKELRELDRSKRELTDLKYRSLTISKDLKVAGRRTSIRRELQNQGSDLEESTSPVIVIK